MFWILQSTDKSILRGKRGKFFMSLRGTLFIIYIYDFEIYDESRRVRGVGL